ncbi:hypothetical protein ACB098_08G044700 [Castanea mollissima]|uniref:Metallothionein-like protein n=1 Tax=Castanea mollissima TaxID=60419 RepID=A0A8J4R944_9ROSI|nr:hypothetical protein CMV_008126 [Castanea mollissima]
MSSSCKCGSSCNCGSGCNCNSNYPVLSEKTSAETIITGVAPAKIQSEGSEMNFGAENGGCKCGSNCSCDPCNCK